LVTSFAQDSTTHQYVPGGAYEVFTADFSSFRHVILDMTWAGAAGNLSMSIDGTTVVAHSLFAAASAGEYVSIGADGISKTTSTWQIRWDNVRIRSK
jgi:hypothetical protein